MSKNIGVTTLVTNHIFLSSFFTDYQLRLSRSRRFLGPNLPGSTLDPEFRLEEGGGRYNKVRGTAKVQPKGWVSYTHKGDVQSDYRLTPPT